MLIAFRIETVIAFEDAFSGQVLMGVCEQVTCLPEQWQVVIRHSEAMEETSGFSFDLCKRNAMLQGAGMKLPKFTKTGTTIVGVVYKVRFAIRHVLCFLLVCPLVCPLFLADVCY